MDSESLRGGKDLNWGCFQGPATQKTSKSEGARGCKSEGAPGCKICSLCGVQDPHRDSCYRPSALCP